MRSTKGVRGRGCHTKKKITGRSFVAPVVVVLATQPLPIGCILDNYKTTLPLVTPAYVTQRALVCRWPRFPNFLERQQDEWAGGGARNRLRVWTCVADILLQIFLCVA